VNARSWAAVHIAHHARVPLSTADTIIEGMNAVSVAVIDVRTVCQMIGAFQAIKELGFFPNLDAEIDGFIAELMQAAGMERT